MENNEIKCAVVIGLREDGGIFFEVHGKEKNLITVEGLLEYGKRHVANAWNEQPKPQPEVADTSNVASPAIEEAEEVEVEVIPPTKKRRGRPRKQA